MQWPSLNWKVFDQYSRNARIYPAVIAAAPAIAGLITLFTYHGVTFTGSIASAGLLAIMYALSDFGRQRGKDIEPRLYAKLGGMPSVRMLRRSDTTFDEPTKERYRAFLAGKLDRHAPTAADEDAEPAKADGFYDAACTWLRENTRDTKKFNILFDNLVSYGFRRNLLGLKWPAVGLNVMVCAICVAVLWPVSWPLDTDDGAVRRVLVVLMVAVIHGLYLLAVVTWRGAGQAAETYGRQLIIATETLAGAAPKPKQSRKKGTTPAAG